MNLDTRSALTSIRTVASASNRDNPKLVAATDKRQSQPRAGGSVCSWGLLVLPCRLLEVVDDLAKQRDSKQAELSILSHQPSESRQHVNAGAD